MYYWKVVNFWQIICEKFYCYYQVNFRHLIVLIKLFISVKMNRMQECFAISYFWNQLSENGGVWENIIKTNLLN